MQYNMEKERDFRRKNKSRQKDCSGFEHNFLKTNLHKL